QRNTWRHLRERFAHSEGPLNWLQEQFYERYAAYFQAYTFVMAHDHELAADRTAAQATNAVILARALVKLAVVGRFLDEVYGPRLYEQVEKSPEPQYLPFAMMPRAFTVAQQQWLRQDWLHHGLRGTAGQEDGHPDLGERLAALGIQPTLP